MTPPPSEDPRIVEAHRLFVVLRALLGPEAIVASVEARAVEQRLFILIASLLQDVGGKWVSYHLPKDWGLKLSQKMRDGTLSDFQSEILIGMTQDWRKGTLVYITKSYLEWKFRGRLKHYSDNLDAGSDGTDELATNDLPQAEDDLPAAEDFRELFENCYRKLIAKVAEHAHLAIVLEEWIRFVGRNGSIQRAATMLVSANATEEDRGRMYRKVRNQFRPAVRDMLLEAFSAFLDFASADGDEDDHANTIVKLLHHFGIGPTKPVAESLTTTDTDDDRIAWLRHEQAKLLEGIQLPENEVERCAALDLLHTSLVKTTEDALRTIKAWAFFDSIQTHRGVNKVAQCIQGHEKESELAKLIQAAGVKNSVGHKKPRTKFMDLAVCFESDLVTIRDLILELHKACESQNAK